MCGEAFLCAFAPLRGNQMCKKFSSQRRKGAKKTFKNGFAPPGALLAALWGDKPAGKLRLYLSSEAVRTSPVLLEVE